MGAVAVAVAVLLSLGPHELAVDAVRVEQLMELLKPFVSLYMKLLCLMNGLYTALIGPTTALIYTLTYAATTLIHAATATATALLLNRLVTSITKNTISRKTVRPINIPIQVPCENRPSAAAALEILSQCRLVLGLHRIRIDKLVPGSGEPAAATATTTTPKNHNRVANLASPSSPPRLLHEAGQPVRPAEMDDVNHPGDVDASPECASCD